MIFNANKKHSSPVGCVRCNGHLGGGSVRGGGCLGGRGLPRGCAGCLPGEGVCPVTTVADGNKFSLDNGLQFYGYCIFRHQT